MKYKLILILLFISGILISTNVFSQKGLIELRNSQNQAVDGASVFINGQLKGLSNSSGNYSIQNSISAPLHLTIKALGYKVKEIAITSDSTTVRPVIILEDSINLDEIIVTAGRRAENVSTVPSSVTILSSKEIEQQRQITTNLSNILGNNIPGLATANNSGSNSGQTLRGRAVLVLVDGIPQSTPLMNGSRDIRTIDPSVIDHIEVIKGATSIYGNGSAGGLINYITKSSNTNRPSFGGETTIRGTINPLHSRATGGYLLAQTINGHSKKWSYIFSGTAEYMGVQRDGEGIVLGTTDALSNSYQYNAFAKIGYQINATSRITGFYNFYSSTAHPEYINKSGVYGKSPATGIKGIEPGKPVGTPYNHNVMLSYSNRGLFSSHTQLDITAYLNSFTSTNRYVASSNSWYGPGQTHINSRKKGLRINLNTPFDIASHFTELTYGLDILSDITNQDLTDGRVYIPDMKMLNIAPYAQLRFDLIDHLIFKGGIRYENAKVKIKDFNTIANGPGNEGSVSVNGATIPYKGATFNAGLRYNKYAYFNPFVSFSQGSAINELGRIVRHATKSDLDSLETGPVITNNYEVGFSSHFGIFDLTASYYISTSKLGIELVSDDNGYLKPIRLPENIHGYELALSVTPSTTWKFGGSYSYVEGNAKNGDGTKKPLNGSRIAPTKSTVFLNFSPGTKLNVQLNYVHTGNRDLFEMNDKGVYNTSEGPVNDVDLLNLTASYRINDKWSLGLGVENLFNNTYYTVYSQYRANGSTYFRGPGTMSSLNVNYKF